MAKSYQKITKTKVTRRKSNGNSRKVRRKRR